MAANTGLRCSEQPLVLWREKQRDSVGQRSDQRASFLALEDCQHGWEGWEAEPEPGPKQPMIFCRARRIGVHRHRGQMANAHLLQSAAKVTNSILLPSGSRRNAA